MFARALDAVMSQISFLRCLPISFRFSLILPLYEVVQEFYSNITTKASYAWLSSHACYMLHETHSPFFDYRSKVEKEIAETASL